MTRCARRAGSRPATQEASRARSLDERGGGPRQRRCRGRLDRTPSSARASAPTPTRSSPAWRSPPTWPLARAGRARWKIERFNCLARHGYNLKRNFGHGSRRSRQPAGNTQSVRLRAACGPGLRLRLVAAMPGQNQRKERPCSRRCSSNARRRACRWNVTQRARSAADDRQGGWPRRPPRPPRASAHRCSPYFHPGKSLRDLNSTSCQNENRCWVKPPPPPESGSSPLPARFPPTSPFLLRTIWGCRGASARQQGRC